MEDELRSMLEEAAQGRLPLEILADWLEERGDRRADEVREQAAECQGRIDTSAVVDRPWIQSLIDRGEATDPPCRSSEEWLQWATKYYTHRYARIVRLYFPELDAKG